MLENSDDYRNKSFIEFWKSERSPFLFISSILIGLGLSIFLIIHSFLNEVNLTGGLFFLGFVLIAYLFYFHIMYGLYRNGYLIYTSIKCNKQVLPNVKIYNGNVDMKFLGFQIILDKGASFPSYDFNKADIILTDYSIILLGTPASFTNFLYLAPIELTFGKKRTNYAQNQAKIIVKKQLRLI